jgi:hypothetical protein
MFNMSVLLQPSSWIVQVCVVSLWCSSLWWNLTYFFLFVSFVKIIKLDHQCDKMAENHQFCSWNRKVSFCLWKKNSNSNSNCLNWRNSFLWSELQKKVKISPIYFNKSQSKFLNSGNLQNLVAIEWTGKKKKFCDKPCSGWLCVCIFSIYYVTGQSLSQKKKIRSISFESAKVCKLN